jgi:hypothetical protein
MPQEDYELAERHWQDLREGRSKRLTADDVQQIANRVGRATDTVQRASRGQIDNAREDAYLATCTLAGEMEANPDVDVDWAWESAIVLAAEWFKATE